MKNIELEHCIFSDDGEVEIEGVGKISNEEMEHIVAYWLEITSDNSECTAPADEPPTPKLCRLCDRAEIICNMYCSRKEGCDSDTDLFEPA